MKLAIEIVNEIADFYHTCIEIEIFDCHSSKELEELMISEMDLIYDYDIDVDSLEDRVLETSMEFMKNRDDTTWLQECIILSQQLHFLKELQRIIYDQNIIFSEKDREDDDDDLDRWE